MSVEQLRNMYQRQINLGGMAIGGRAIGGRAIGGSASGGFFTPQSKAGLMEYQAFRKAHPGLSRAELSREWKMHKMGMAGSALVGGARMSKGIQHCMEEKIGPSGLRRCAKFMRGPRMGSALVGGYSDMTPMKGMGGARMAKGIRHCMEEKMGPSGLRRCAKYAAGPRGSALVGGFEYQQKLFNAYKKMFPSANATERRCAFYNARQAYENNKGKDFRAGVAAALHALGLPPNALGRPVSELEAPRRRSSRAVSLRGAIPPRARAPRMSPEEALEMVYGEEGPSPAEQEAMLAQELAELGLA